MNGLFLVHVPNNSLRDAICSSRFGPGPQTAVTNADLDFISIQFYNNGCGIQAFFGEQILGGGTFNFDQWSTAVTKANKNMKVILGIPASQTAGDGFQSAQNIKKIVDSIKKNANFAGQI